jgi:hypothetical protein
MAGGFIGGPQLTPQGRAQCRNQHKRDIMAGASRLVADDVDGKDDNRDKDRKTDGEPHRAILYAEQVCKRSRRTVTRPQKTLADRIEAKRRMLRGQKQNAGKSADELLRTAIAKVIVVPDAESRTLAGRRWIGSYDIDQGTALLDVNTSHRSLILSDDGEQLEVSRLTDHASERLARILNSLAGSRNLPRDCTSCRCERALCGHSSVLVG